MNSLPLRKLIRRYGNLGYLVVGCYLLGYWLFHFKRRQTAAALALLLLTVSASSWLGTSLRVNANERHSMMQGGAASYTLTDLGVISGYDYSIGQYINARGQTAGLLSDKDGEKLHGFWCTSGGQMSDIGTLGGDFSFTSGINDEGYVVGTSFTKSEELRGFVWNNGKMTRIGTLGGQISIAEGINNKGQAVGIADTARGIVHAFVWKDGGIKDIGASCPGQFNGATAINDNGDVAGIFTDDGETLRGFVLGSGGKSRALPSLGGTFTVPTALSAKAVVGIGTLKADDEIVHGFVTTTGGVQDIGTLGGENSAATGINNSGQVVGVAETANGMPHAILWQNGKLTDLNTLIPSGSGWELLFAGGINERGQIVGTSVIGNTIHAFILTPKG